MSVTVTIEKGVAEVYLDHPPVNALDSAGWEKLAETLASVGRDSGTRVVILAARGRGFCAGVDIKELAADSSVITRVNRGCYDAFAAIHDCPVPVVAACHGFVLGGGIGLVGSCDIIVASDDASFGLPEIDRGALGAASHLLRMFPIQKVRKMLFTGEPIGADEAYRLGALEAVVSRDALLPKAREIAASIASKSPKAMRLAKESLNGIETLDVKKSYRFEQGFTLELYTSPDSQEARDAFVEKRAARFGDEDEE
ncbi:MAG: enoyl-CoA hydratase family protein [Deltaproteobacteria bacterium]|nr:MAG: enoyl-CoA hydratase family protein [Deltaproteobacteria bacterium]